MSTDDAQVWTLRYREVATQLTAITYRTQLVQRQILRADGLTSLQRNLLLSNMAAITLGVQALGSQARDWADEDESSHASLPRA